MVKFLEKINWWWFYSSNNSNTFYSSNKYSYGILEEIMVMVVNICIGCLDQFNFLFETNRGIWKLVAKPYFDSCGCNTNTVLLTHLIIY